MEFSGCSADTDAESGPEINPHIYRLTRKKYEKLRIMFESVLVANRGEIACRIIRTARRMGLRTIAIYSEADRSALHVSMADEAFEIGPPPSADSYLQSQKILELARRIGADSVHPGYGFLSENADFADQCAREQIVFIGPPVQAMRKMARKDLSKAIVADAGIPVVPGFLIEREADKTLLDQVGKIGFPVMIKAVSGGGGKGLRQVDSADELEVALDGAMREAQSSFGDGRVMIEKCIQNPRHIEVQVFGDGTGNVVHLFERDCSLQRRHQKVIEEAPAPNISRKFREKICQAGVMVARSVGYQGAGTVEFLVEGEPMKHRPQFYFMEMNTRLQVEHPVTEMITGLDLVEWQIRIAAGEALPENFGTGPIQGHAVEARLYAEDPGNGFLPSTGKLLALNIPNDKDIRVDTGVETGTEITPYYDPMIAKVIAHGQSRKEALVKLSNVLQRTTIVGPKTNAGFLLRLLSDRDVAAASLSTGLIGSKLKTLVTWYPDPQAIALGVFYLMATQDWGPVKSGNSGFEQDKENSDTNVLSNPWNRTDGFQLGGERYLKRTFIVDGEMMEVGFIWTQGELRIKVDDRYFVARQISVKTGGFTVYPSTRGCFVACGPNQIEVEIPDLGLSGVGGNRDGGLVLAPMHGKIVQMLVGQDQHVVQGQPLVVLEAMKMEHIIRAPHDGVLASLSVTHGQQVSAGEPVLEVRPDGPDQNLKH